MPQFNARLKNENHVKIFSSPEELTEIDFYTIPTIGNEVEYNCVTNQSPENDERLFVTLNDDQIGNMIGEYQNSLSSTGELNTITRDHYNNIDVLYLVDNDNCIFTKISKGYIVKDTTLLFVGNLGPEIKQQDAGIEFDGHIDVYFNNQSKKLYFKNFNKAKSIFKGLISFYRVASNEEVDQFLSNDFFEVSDSFKKEKIGERLLKDIANIIDTNQIDFSDTNTRTQYNQYANEFECEINISPNGKFKIQRNSNLTGVIKLLQGRYYKDYINPSKKMEAINTKPLS